MVREASHSNALEISMQQEFLDKAADEEDSDGVGIIITDKLSGIPPPS
jgi:hypothetical protein